MNEDTEVIPEVANPGNALEGDDPDGDLLDGELEQPRRSSMITRILLSFVLLVLGFLGGVGVQKMSQGLADAPILSGTVQSITGNTLKVADSSAAITEVTVPDTATVSTRGLGALAVGDAIAVAGTRQGDGVLATTITMRPMA